MPALPSLHYAIFKNEKEIVNSLINWGVNINICDSNYSNALAYAYLYEKKEMIELLISQGATCCETKPIL
ncbi:MAG TPA: ankyrin repeat domain-containing protein [Sulfurovum sp.]|nr:ankyrin repeat domain-containing protein [Sulfurovum sp.]